MVQIKFIRQGSNSALGGFSSGDLARVSEAMARHLVEEAKVAVYAETAAPKAAPAATARRRKAKEAK